MKSRRKFIRNMTLTAGGVPLLASNLWGNDRFQEKSAISGTSTRIQLVELQGRVESLGKGLSGVSVSDGVQVVQTDASGYFKFTSVMQREFVFISIPSGYRIPQLKNGSADYFRRINKKHKINKFLFNLEPEPVEDGVHHFLVLADPQIQKADEAEMLLTTTVPDVQHTVRSFSDQSSFGVGCGDLVWDRHELFADYNRAVQQLEVPFFQVLGNHDMDLNERSDERSTQTFNSLYGPHYYSFNKGELHYVVLDDVFFIGRSKEYIGYLSEEQLMWLEEDLKFVEPGSTVVVFLHIPSYTGFFDRNPEQKSLGAMLSNREYLYELLEPFNTHIMSGHTHFNENVILSDRLFEHCHGTVCGAWWSGPICYDGTPNGYGVYTVKNSGLEWYYKGTGLSKNEQFRIYPRGEHPEYKHLWSVNVWNWDPQWKVYWYENGSRKGEMTRIIARDPLSIKLHKGSKIPKHRAWVEPELTEHMFFFSPSKDAKTITVEVIDRFGNTFHETMENI